MRSWLDEHKVPIGLWGTGSAKSVEHLWAEGNQGECTLTYEEGRALRELRVVKLRVLHPTSTQYLIEQKQTLANGNERVRGGVPGEKLIRDELAADGALRGVKEELGWEVVGAPRLLHTTVEVKPSESYPGLMSRYTFYEYALKVQGLAEGHLKPEFKTVEGDKTHHWQWRDAIVQPSDGLELRDADVRLIERLFEKATCVRVSPLHGGLSGSLVLRSQALYDEHADEPTVIKLDAAKALKTEVARTKAAARFGVPVARVIRGPVFSEEQTAHSLAFVEAKIDAPLRERLKDGSIRLVRCSWLRSAEADAAFSRGPLGEVIVKRRQDLPPEAFVPAAEAADMLRRDDRSVLALSQAWQTPQHPDPHGKTLKAVRNYLITERDTDSCGLFWDFLSIYQKNPIKWDRTEDEEVVFRRGLDVMTLLYASLTGTTVLLQTEVPARPQQYEGQLTVWNVSDEAVLEKEMAQYGKVKGITMTGTTATVSFETEPEAENAQKALLDERACRTYNDREYKARGWTSLEQGAARIVAAHLKAAEGRLPLRFQMAQESRPKIIDISGGRVTKDVPLNSPKCELENAKAAIECAKFTGKGDEDVVKGLLASFNSVVLDGLERWAREPAQATEVEPRGAVVLELAGACWMMPEFSGRAGGEQAGDDPLISTLKTRATSRLMWRHANHSWPFSGLNAAPAPEIADAVSALFGPGGPISTLALRSVHRALPGGDDGNELPGPKYFGRWRTELAARAVAVLVSPDDRSSELASALRGAARDAEWLEKKHAARYADSFVHELEPAEREAAQTSCEELPTLLERLRDVPRATRWAPLQVQVHGDLNLSNVLIDKRGELWLIDFANFHVDGVADDAAFFISRLLFQHSPIPPTPDDVRKAKLKEADGSPRPNLLVDVLGLSAAKAKQLQEKARGGGSLHGHEWLGDGRTADAALREMEQVVDALFGCDDPWAPERPKEAASWSAGAREVFELCVAVAKCTRGLCARCCAKVNAYSANTVAEDAHASLLLLPLLGCALASLRYPQLSRRHKRLAWHAVRKLSTALQQRMAEPVGVPGTRVLPPPTGLPWVAGQPVVLTRSMIDGSEGNVRLDVCSEVDVRLDICSEVVLPWRKGADGAVALEDARHAREDVATLKAMLLFDTGTASTSLRAEPALTALRAAALTSDAARRAVAKAVTALDSLVRDERGEIDAQQEAARVHAILDTLWGHDVDRECVAAWRATGVAGVRTFATGTLLTATVDGLRWRDARVEGAEGCTHRLVWLDDDSHVQVALHPWNHGLLELPADDHDAARRQYERTLGTDHAAIVDALSGKRLDVRHQCVPLAVATGEDKEHFGDVGALAEKLLQFHRGRCEEGVAEKHGGVLLTGPAAAGKTCLISQLVTHVLKDPDRRLVPVLVRVQQLQRLLLLEEHRDIFATAWNWVDAYLRCVHGADADVYRMLRGAMRARRALLLLDGMDEGGRMRAAIERHVAEVLAPQGHVLLATSRPEGLDKTRFDEHFLALELQPLNETQQHNVIKQRVGKERGDTLWREIASTARRDELNVTSNPLMLSMVISLFEARGALPRNVAELYAAASRAMLEGAERKERGAAGVEHVRSIIQAVFFEAHVAGRRIIEEEQMLAAAVGLHASAAGRLTAIRWPVCANKPKVGEYAEVQKGPHAGRRGEVSIAVASAYEVKFEDGTTSGKLESDDLMSSGKYRADFGAAYHLKLREAHDALPVELREALDAVRDRVRRGRLPLLSLLQASPLQLQASHLSFQEYHAACALCDGVKLPSGQLPWQWTVWWANVLRIGEAQGAAFQAGLLCAADVGESLKLSRRVAKSPTALRAVLLLAEKVSHVDLSDNELDEAEAAEVTRALDVMSAKERQVLTNLSVASNLKIMGKAAQQLAAAALGSSSLEVLSGVPIKELREDKLTELKLQRKGLGQTEGIVLAELIRSSAVLKNLSVAWNNIDGEAAEQLAKAVLSSTSLEIFSEIPIKELRADVLTEQNLVNKGFGVSGALVVSELFKLSAVLKHCNLLHNNLDVQSAKMLAMIGMEKGIMLSGMKHDQTKADFRSLKLRLGPADGILIGSDLKSMEMLTIIDLRFNLIGTAGATAIVDALSSARLVLLTSLDLYRNNIGDEGAKAIAGALQGKAKLTSLTLSWNNIGAGGVEAIADALQSSMSELTFLHLQDNSLGAAGAKAIADALQSGKTKLADLNLRANNISTEGAKAITDALKSGKTVVTTLNLAVNQIGNDGAKGIADALSSAKTLTILNLSDNKINKVGAEAIANALQSGEATLTSLDLRFNDIGPAGVKAISEALSSGGACLTDLNLHNTALDNNGAMAIAKVLRSGKSNLTSLILGQNMIDEEGAKAIAGALQLGKSNLTSLILGQNMIGEEGAKAIAGALQSGKSKLTSLGLSGNQISAGGAKAIAVALKGKAMLQKLNLEQNNIGNDGAKAIADALSSRSRLVLTSLDIRYNNLGDEGKKAVRDLLKDRRPFELVL